MAAIEAPGYLPSGHGVWLRGGAFLPSGSDLRIEAGVPLPSGWGAGAIEAGAFLPSSASLTVQAGALLPVGWTSIWMDLFFINPPGSPGYYFE